MRFTTLVVAAGNGVIHVLTANAILPAAAEVDD